MKETRDELINEIRNDEMSTDDKKNKAHQLIELGIAEKSWEKVIKGYNKLAGKKIRLTKSKVATTPENETEIKDKFFVDNGPPRKKNDKGQVAALTKPWEPSVTNRFKDDRKLETQDIKESKRLSAKAVPKDYRKPFREISTQCSKCDKTFQVHPSLVSRSLDGDENKYICDKCVRNSAKRD